MKKGVRYIAVEGAIGVGKTSLARKLASHYGAELILEKVEGNPLLPLYYQDMRRYAFNLQLFFLVHRSEQQRAIQRLRAEGKMVVSDYIFAKDDLFARMTLSDKQYEIYTSVVKELETPHVRPDVVVYLFAPVELLLERVAKRGRSFEREIPREYLERVAKAYSDFFATYDRTPLLRVNSEKCDPLSDEKDFDRLLKEITDAAR